MPQTQDMLLCAPLTPTASEAESLQETLEAFRAAVALVHARGLAEGTASNALLHRACYEDVRAACELPANLVVRAIARAAYRLRGEPRPPLAELQSVGYDRKVASWTTDGALTLSLSTVRGRLRSVAATLKAPQRGQLQRYSPRRGVLIAAPRGFTFVFYLRSRVRPDDLALAERTVLSAPNLPLS